MEESISFMKNLTSVTSVPVSGTPNKASDSKLYSYWDWNGCIIGVVI